MGLQIDIIGFKSFLRSLFGRESSFVRELVQNAMEAIHAAQQAGGIKTKGRIDISVDLAARRIAVSDNGCGMTDTELTRNLSEAFKSGWQQQGEKVLGVGQYGFGFFSSLLVADQVEVYTSSQFAPDTKYRWSIDCNTGDVSQHPVVEGSSGHGTIVSIVLREEYSHFLTSEYLIGEIRDFFLFLSLELYVAGARVNLPSRAQWARLLSDSRSHDAIVEEIKEAFDWDEDKKPAIVFACDEGILATAPDSPAPATKIYRHGVFLLETEIIPEPLNHIFCGVFNVDELNVRPDRTSYADDEVAHAFRKRLFGYISGAYEKLMKRGGEQAVEFFKNYREALIIGVMVHNELAHLRTSIPLTQVKGHSIVSSLATTWERFKSVIKSDRVLYTEDPVSDRKMIEYFAAQGDLVLFVKNHAEKGLAKHCARSSEIRLVSVSECYLSTQKREAVTHPQLERLFRNVPGCDAYEVVCVKDDDIRFPTRVMTHQDEKSEMLEMLGALASLVGMDDKKLQHMMKGDSVLLINLNHPAIITIAEGLENGASRAHLRNSAQALFLTALLIDGGDMNTSQHIALAESLQNLISAALQSKKQGTGLSRFFRK